MKREELYNYLKNQHHDVEFKRLFHGRGGLFEGWKHLTIDSIDDLLSVALYTHEEGETELLEMLEKYAHEEGFKALCLQRRYEKDTPTQTLFGEIKEPMYLTENGMKMRLNLLSNQNSGYFADMKNGRSFVKEHAKDKRVLNLFAYTCGFSVAAKLGGAKEVINVDMSKGALSVGKANHAANAIDPRGVSYLPYNILKSFGGLKRKGPYDLIIIDPPSFQKGSFAATKDYEKIIKKVPELASDNATLLLCLNSPDLDSAFLKDLVKVHAAEFVFVERLENVAEFASADEERSLKNLIFKRANFHKEDSRGTIVC